MPRKKRKDADATPPVTDQTSAVATESAPQAETVTRPAYIDGPPTDEHGQIIAADPRADGEQDAGQAKNWGPPYKAIFTCQAKGFELGENRRFRQRVFKFTDKPDPDVLAALKEAGFIYRPEEKAWTIHADESSRLLSDRLAFKFAGEAPSVIRG